MGFNLVALSFVLIFTIWLCILILYWTTISGGFLYCTNRSENLLLLLGIKAFAWLYSLLLRGGYPLLMSGTALPLW